MLPHLDAAQRTTSGVTLLAVAGNMAELATLVALRARGLHRAHRGDVAEFATVEAFGAASATRGALRVRVRRLRAVTR